jgi:STE24 endopeptidase
VDRARLRLPIAVVAAIVVAEGAVLLLRPRDGVITPARVDVHDYFTSQQIKRARDYGRPQLALYGASLLVQGGLLVLLIRRPPRRLRGLAGSRRPILAGGVAGAGIVTALTIAALPISAISRQRSVDVGLSTQSWGGWGADVAKSAAIDVVFAAAGGALLLGLVRRFPRRWWIPGSVGVVAVSTLFVYAGPAVLDPLFNKFTEIPPGPVRSEVLDLAKRSHVKVDHVYEIDASRRTTAANAYVTGLGATKRVVLYDTLLKRFKPAERRVVVAHELGHVHYDDVPHGLLFLALVAPFGTLAVKRLTDAMTPEGGSGTAAMFPALLLSLAIVSTGITTVSNQLSRRIEARADSFSLRISHEPKAFIDSEKRLTLQNLSDPDPPDWITWLLGTHPPTIERIGIAVAYERGAR